MKNFFIKSALAVCLLGIAMQTKAQNGAAVWEDLDTDAEYFIREIDSEGAAGRYLTYNRTNGTASFTATTDIFNQAWRFFVVEGDGDNSTTEYYLVSSKIVTEGVAIADVEHINDKGVSIIENSPGWHAFRVYIDEDDKFSFVNINSGRGTYYINNNIFYAEQSGNNADPPTTGYLFSIETIEIDEEVQAAIQSNFDHAQAVVDEVEAQQNAGITVFGTGGRYQDADMYIALSSALSSANEAVENVVSIHDIYPVLVELENEMYALFATPVISAGDFYLRHALDSSKIIHFASKTYLQGDGTYNTTAATDQIITFKFHQSYVNGPVAIECGTGIYFSPANSDVIVATETPDSVVFHYDISINAYAMQSIGGKFVYNTNNNKQEIKTANSTISADNLFFFSIIPKDAGIELYKLQTAIKAAQTLAAKPNGEGYSYGLYDEFTTFISECEDIWLWKHDVAVADITSTITALSTLTTTDYPASLQFDKNVTLTAEKWVGIVVGSGTLQNRTQDLGQFFGGTNNGTVCRVGNYDFSQGLDTIAMTYGAGTNNDFPTLGKFLIYVGNPDDGGVQIAEIETVNTNWTGKATSNTTNLTNKPASGISPIYVKWTTQINACSIKFAVAPDAEITENTTISQNTAYHNVRVASGAALTIASGVTLTVDSISLKSGATLVNEGMLTARIATVEQSLSTANSREWYYLSSPVTEAASTVFGTNKVGDYDEATASYSAPFTEGTPLEAGRGYVVKLTDSEFSGFVTFAGQLNDGDISVPVTRTGTDDETQQGFNLVGNPYPSYLDWGSVAKSNVQTTVWTRTYEDNEMVFKTYNADSQVGDDDQTTAHIAPLQAFWVRVPSDAGESDLTLDFTNAERLHKDTDDSPLRAAQAETRPILRLQVSNGTNKDNAVILFDDRATDAFDSYDSEKMSNNNAVIPEIYTLAGTEAVAINTLRGAPENHELALGFKTGTAGTFGISIHTLKNIAAVTLIDKIDEVEFNLTEDSYEFTSDVTDNADRFAIVFRMPTGLQNTEKQSVSVYANDNRIVVKGAVTQPVSRVQVFNVAGQKLTDQISGGETIVINRTFEAGVYLVKINGETRKIIVK